MWKFCLDACTMSKWWKLYTCMYLSLICRDIKPSNIFVKDNDALCLGDFGVSTVMGDLRTCPRNAVGKMRRSTIIMIVIVNFLYFLSFTFVRNVTWKKKEKGRFFALHPRTLKHIRSSWSHYTETREAVVGYGANNMVTGFKSATFWSLVYELHCLDPLYM
jgi:serine/threonine protein kinase